MKLRPPYKKKGKTYKRPYTGSKRFDHTCRNHGSCGYCRDQRTYNLRKVREAMEIEISQEVYEVRTEIT